MATGLRQIQRDLLDALRGRNGEEPASSPRASRSGGRASRPGRANPATADTGPPSPRPPSGRPPPASSRQDRLFESRASESAAHRGNGPGGTSIFQDVRARAREVVQGFREGRVGAGDRLRSLRDPPGRDADGTGTLRRQGGGASISPPWRRTPALPEPPGPPPPGHGKPRLKKLRLALVILGLTLLAMVSWFFGIMMSVAQDLPALE